MESNKSVFIFQKKAGSAMALLFYEYVNPKSLTFGIMED